MAWIAVVIFGVTSSVTWAAPRVVDEQVSQMAADGVSTLYLTHVGSSTVEVRRRGRVESRTDTAGLGRCTLSDATIGAALLSCTESSGTVQPVVLHADGQLQPLAPSSRDLQYLAIGRRWVEAADCSLGRCGGPHVFIDRATSELTRKTGTRDLDSKELKREVRSGNRYVAVRPRNGVRTLVFNDGRKERRLARCELTCFDYDLGREIVSFRRGRKVYAYQSRTRRMRVLQLRRRGIRPRKVAYVENAGRDVFVGEDAANGLFVHVFRVGLSS